MMELNLHEKCPLCGSTDIRKKFKKASFTLDRCDNCTILFVKNILTKEEINRVYEEVFDHGAYDESNVEGLNFYYERLKKEIDQQCQNGGSILDIGCSAGQFLDVMQGWDRHGVEISDRYAAIARDKYGENIFSGNIEDYPLESDPFDVITLQDVFDHFTDPVSVLAKCRHLLKPNGHIFIKVHNIGCLFAKLTQSNFYAIIPPVHLFFFNVKSLSHLLENSGFSVGGHKFIPHILKLRTVFYRLAGESQESFYFKIYKALRGTFIGDKIYIRKNLHDIVTMYAQKNDAALTMSGSGEPTNSRCQLSPSRSVGT